MDRCWWKLLPCELTQEGKAFAIYFQLLSLEASTPKKPPTFHSEVHLFRTLINIQMCQVTQSKQIGKKATQLQQQYPAEANAETPQLFK